MDNHTHTWEPLFACPKGEAERTEYLSRRLADYQHCATCGTVGEKQCQGSNVVGVRVYGDQSVSWVGALKRQAEAWNCEVTA